jgi:hypothetical protein
LRRSASSEGTWFETETAASTSVEPEQSAPGSESREVAAREVSPASVQESSTVREEEAGGAIASVVQIGARPPVEAGLGSSPSGSDLVSGEDLAGASEPGSGLRDAAALLSPSPTPVVPSVRESGADAGAVAVRRVTVSRRGKRDFNHTWASEDVAIMRAEHAKYLGVYRQAWRERDPQGSYRLVFSAFIARALEEALDEVGEWVETIRNDARKVPVLGGREQVGVVWPVALDDRLVDLCESFDRSLLPAGFGLTKQHVASAAILHGLRSVPTWVLSVPNDDRFSVPAAGDGRLRKD